MKSKINDFLSFVKEDGYVKNYMLATGVAISVDWMILPLFTKLMGFYLPIFVITMYYVISEMAGFIEHYFHDTDISKVFKVLVLMDLVQILCLSSFFYDQKVFAYLMVVVFGFQAVLYEIYSVKSIQFVERHREVPPSRFQSHFLFNKSLGVFVGLSVSALYALLFEDFGWLIGMVMILMVLSVVSELKLLRFVLLEEKVLVQPVNKEL